MTTPQVFISHINEEAPVADALKVYLKRCLGQALSVFVSSDYDSIGTGEEWYHAIVDGLLGARAVIVLLSRYSVDRRWMNFEAGVAVGAKHRVLPVTIRSFPPAQVGLPLGQLHVRVLTDVLALESLIETIGEIVGQQYTIEDGTAFIDQLQRIEATLPVKGIALEPFLQPQSDSSLILRFRLGNTGNRDVELIEIEVPIPKYIVVPQWHAPRIPNALYFEEVKLGTIDHIILRETPFEGQLDVVRYGTRQFLPKVISPHWTPRPSDFIKIPLRQDLQDLTKFEVKFKVVARDVYAEEHSVSLNDIPTLS